MLITVLSGPDHDKNYGDCFIIDDGNKLYIYDCGSEELANNVIYYMNQKGYSKAIAILSHNDSDHFDGIKYLIDKGYDSEYGARPLRRLIEQEIEDRIAEQFLEGTISPNSTIIISAKENKLNFKISREEN